MNYSRLSGAINITNVNLLLNNNISNVYIENTQSDKDIKSITFGNV